MSDKDFKLSRDLTPDEVPGFLRSLADELEGKIGEEEKMLPAGLGDLSRLKIGVKTRGARVEVSLKGKTAGAKALSVVDGGEGARGRDDGNEDGGGANGGNDGGQGRDGPKPPKYKKLKKRMKADYKVIFNETGSGRMPDAALVDSFISDSLAMVSYPDKGEERYEAYRGAVGEFKEAFEAGNLELFREKTVALGELKTACHARYK